VSDIPVIATRIVYANRWMRVREDRFEHDDGTQGLYGVVEKLDYSLVIPRDPGGVFLVEQYRYPVQKRYWEFPQGTWEERPSASPLEVAREELEAETGLRAGSFELLGDMYGAYGLTAQRCHVFVARELTQGQARPDPEEGDLQVRHVSDADFWELVDEGKIKDGPTLAAYALLVRRETESGGAA
jgi:8-oxo-dGTP pyrophosphatase MutT (NUDIX family)